MIRLQIESTCQICGVDLIGKDAFMAQTPGSDRVVGPYCAVCIRTLAAAHPPQSKALEHPGRQEAL